MNKFTIVRDTREKPAYGWSYDEDAHCAGTIVRKVDVGDYTIDGLEDILCIERKRTIDEFAHNCVEKRWKVCIENMSRLRHAYLLFEFGWCDINNYPLTSKAPPKVRRKIRISSKFIRKNIYDIRQQGIHVLICEDKVKAEQVAYRLMKKAYELYQIRC